MHRMRVRTLATVAVALGIGLGCRARAPARSVDGGNSGGAAASTVSTPPNAATLIACGNGGCPRLDGGPAQEGGELVIHVEAEPALLCDLVEHDAWSRWILENQVVETLLFQDPWTGKLTPRLAATVDVKPDALTLRLRPNLRWHDGKPLTSADVAFTIGLARDPKIGADQRIDFEPVSAVEIPDAATVVLHLARPAPLLPQALAHLGILPIHMYQGKDVRRAEASRAPVGTGPFRFVSWRQGEELVLERNPDYWGPKAHLARLRFRFIRDRQVAYELYLRGEIDLLWSVPPQHFDEVRAEPRLVGHRIYDWTPRAYFFIVWNCEHGRLADARVRRALALLVDRARFDRIAFLGHARPITGPFAPGTPSYDASVPPWPFDPAAAKKLLEEVGIKSMKLTFLATAGSRTVEQLATLLKEDLALAGITLEVATVDFAVQLDRLRRHAFDASALQWTMTPEQDAYTLFHSSQAANGQNYGGWRHAGADALLDQIRVTVDDEARYALERKLHRLVHEEQPYAFLSMREVETLMSPRVRGLSPSQDGFNFAEAWIPK
jgi:peptide/nickel transport system substrate-binding protein